ncbi:pantoate--beta-alanine ligase [Hyphococcus sp.]|uniref:pantoate--beta-alanine ligase n=1 Tax=Hyphococcus sp. TaxID=2038636 RepID=UPI003CCB864D
MQICRTKSEIREVVSAWREEGRTIGLVPTMGALHQGHLSLLDISGKNAARTAASIFINPLQFAPHEDFESYPRDLEADYQKLQERGCDVVFAPERAALFADDFSTNISVGGLGENHCAITRPHFFDGVATIVAKLFMIVKPDIAVFGEKDFQQLAVIRRMVRDLDIDVRIFAGPILRETDGLAMSSRNMYLTPDERAAAPALQQTLLSAARAAIAPDAGWEKIRTSAVQSLRDAGFGEIDYVNLVDAASLEEIERADRPARILAAAWMGRTRLIDNVPAGPGDPG